MTFVRILASIFYNSINFNKGLYKNFDITGIVNARIQKTLKSYINMLNKVIVIRISSN